MKPFVSVIIPVYKVEKYLRECIDSVLLQDFHNFEIIIVDDGSPDNCPQLCDEYAQLDSRIKAYHKPNGGLSDARNYGLKHATGEYILFLDSDDLWYGINCLSSLYQKVMDNPDVDLVFFQKYTFVDGHFCSPPSDISLLDESLNGLDKVTILQYFAKRGNLLTSAYVKLIKHSLLKENEIEFQHGLLSEDFDWTFKLYPAANKICLLGLPFYAYRKREGSITTTISSPILFDLVFIINKWKKEVPGLRISEEERLIYFGFLCYIYSILLGLYTKAKKSEDKNKIWNEIEGNRAILNFANNKKTRLVKLLVSLFGLHITSKILSCYINHK